MLKILITNRACCNTHTSDICMSTAADAAVALVCDSSDVQWSLLSRQQRFDQWVAPYTYSEFSSEPAPTSFILISTGAGIHPIGHSLTFCDCVSSSLYRVQRLVQWWQWLNRLGTRPLICRGMFPGIISGDASPISSPRTLIWTEALILFAQAVLMHQ